MVAHDHVGKEKVLPNEVKITSTDQDSEGTCIQIVQVKKNKDTSLVCVT